MSNTTSGGVPCHVRLHGVSYDGTFDAYDVVCWSEGPTPHIIVEGKLLWALLDEHCTIHYGPAPA